MKIALDIDDVVMDFWRSLEESITLEFGIDLDYEANTDFNNTPVSRLDVFGPGLTWWDWLRSRDWVWATFGPVPGALGGIQRLRDRGHYVELVTKKPEWAEWTVWKWLGRWRPAANSVRILGLDDNKAEFSDARILIDDNLDNIQKWLDTGREAIIFDRPWNRLTRIAPRAYDWDEVLELVQIAEREGLTCGV